MRTVNDYLERIICEAGSVHAVEWVKAECYNPDFPETSEWTVFVRTPATDQRPATESTIEIGLTWQSAEDLAGILQSLVNTLQTEI